MKRYIAKMPCETIGKAKEWAIDELGDSKKIAHQSGKEGIQHGMGKQYQLVEITYKILPKIYKSKTK